MTILTSDLTVDNFSESTGFRFRVSREQKARIDANELTREGAFQEFLASGGLERLQGRPQDIPDSIYLDPDLTVENFASKVEAIIGKRRRFRVSREQKARVKAGELTRTDALAEIVSAKRAALAANVETAN